MIFIKVDLPAVFTYNCMNFSGIKLKRNIIEAITPKPLGDIEPPLLDLS
jgi:hypothetical protein